MDPSRENTPVASDQQPATIQPLPTDQEIRMASMELLTRFLIGALAEGGAQLFSRLREYQDTLAEQEAIQPIEGNLDEASRDDLIRYLAVGSAVRAQRGAARALYGGASLTARTTRSIFGVLDRVTDNPLGRPLRRPVESLADRLRDEINESVVVGHEELNEGRLLAREATLDIIDDFIAYLSESPELAQLVSDQIGQQSLGMASAAAETSRTITKAADNSIEGVVRRILGLPSRQELEPSPFAGRPEVVYHPGVSSSIEESIPNEPLE